ncbi:FG-GAP-like repeat-containing protein [Verrucomicrobiota bacterium sgz303538]
MKPLALSAFTLIVTSVAFAQQPVPTGEFKKIQLTDQFWAEGANFGDFNKDGKMDVVSGPYWWEGPDFQKRHTYYPDTKRSKIKKQDGTEAEIAGFKGALSNENEYSDNFLCFTRDFNGDGWTDVLVIGFPGKEAFWFENPQGKDQPWEKHLAWDVVDNESPMFADITGDGKPEIICSSGGYLGYAEPDSKNPNAKWTWHNISPKGPWQRFTHGIGIGDVNGDGRMDMLEASGWWEQPASLANDPEWKKHEALFGNGGAQMYVYDVNGDGRNDVITSLEAHRYGLAWFEQTNEGGVQGWTKHLLVGSKPEENSQGVKFSQPHAIDLVDMNGDGLKDIVTGKRFWAHGPSGDAEPNAPAVLYWFELKRNGTQANYVAHLIDDNSGIGTQVIAGDINGDQKPDVVVGNKRGAFVFLRQ